MGSQPGAGNDHDNNDKDDKIMHVYRPLFAEARGLKMLGNSLERNATWFHSELLEHVLYLGEEGLDSCLARWFKVDVCSFKRVSWFWFDSCLVPTAFLRVELPLRRFNRRGFISRGFTETACGSILRGFTDVFLQQPQPAQPLVRDSHPSLSLQEQVEYDEANFLKIFLCGNGVFF